MADRLEVKYFVDRTTRTALGRDLRALMGADTHAGTGGTYAVRSIYFDTPDYLYYHEKLEGLPNRDKPRVRVYGDDPGEAAFVRLEVKSRRMTHGHKASTVLSREAYEDIDAALRRRTLPPAVLLEDPAVRAFFHLVRMYNLEPKVLVQYRREPLERREGGRIRVNLDDELVATRRLDLFGPLGGAHRILDYGHAVFEIKAEDFLPGWLHTLIGKYDLWNEAISKYCLAVRSECLLSEIGRANDEY